MSRTQVTPNIYHDLNVVVGRVAALERTFARNASPTWTALPYAVNWSDYGSNWQTGTYTKDGQGFIHIRGLVKKSTAWTTSDTIATLPAGYRPGVGEIYNVVGYDASAGYAMFRIDIYPSGLVTLNTSLTTITTPSTMSFLTLSAIPPFQQGN